MEKQFYEAAGNGEVEEAEEILRNNPTLDINRVDENGNAALHYACGKGRYSIVSILLGRSGIDVNLKNKRGSTPLCSSVAEGFEGQR